MMHKHRGRLSLLLILLIMLAAFTGCSTAVEDPEKTELELDEDGYYSSAEDVALYDPQKGNLWDVTDKMSIGGDRFGNREKLLPEEDGRVYFECDINYEGGYRGSERLVYSNDGLIFYTEDHYESFEQLY